MMKALQADQNANQDCDLLIKGGAVIDPDQDLHVPPGVVVRNGKMLDVPRIPNVGCVSNVKQLPLGEISCLMRSEGMLAGLERP
jgi:glycerate kinase